MARKQFRLYVPDNDPVSLEWCENQGRDLSVAIRQLIQKGGETSALFTF